MERVGYESLFRALVDDALPDPLFIHDDDGRLVAVNDLGCLALGYTRAELLQMRVSDIEADRDLPTMQAAWRLLAPGIHATIYGRQRRRDGMVFPVQIRLTAAQRDDRRLYIAVVRDLTQPQKTESALRESELRYATLFENSHLAIAVTRVSDQRIIDVNPAFEHFAGYARAEVIGRTPLEVGLWVDPAERTDLMQRVLRGERVSAFVARTRHKSGDIRYGQCSVRVLDLDGSPHLVSIIADVTDQRRADALLRESEERYRTMFMTSFDAMVVSDLADFRIFDVNEAFCRTFGWTRAEAVGVLAERLGLWPSTELRAEYIRQLRIAGRREGVETTLQTKSGRPLRIILDAHSVELGGRHCVLSVLRDVTDRRRAEAELDRHRHHLEELVAQRTRELVVARDLAESANVAKSAFLANMSHEIRTPMNGVLGVAYLLKRTGLSAKQADYVGKIEMAGKHLLEIINAVLELSKIEAGKYDIQTADVDVGQVVGNVALILADLAGTKGLKLSTDVAPLPRGLRGDPTRLQQALLNYANNAVKFTEKGSVTIRARAEEEAADSVLVRFEVEDTGIGIAPEAISRLFGAFEQVDPSPTRAYGGTGLGLVITRKLAELMGGASGVASVPGVGSTFWFTARLARPAVDLGPAAPAGPSVEAVTAALRAHATGRRVLVVEDNALSREIVLQLLDDVGLQADSVDNGASAVEFVARGGYDLVVMDWQLPVLDGLAATRQIRALGDRGLLPIVALTASAYEEDRQRCLAAGMNDFVTKPIDPPRFFGTLLDWLAFGGPGRR